MLRWCSLEESAAVTVAYPAPVEHRKRSTKCGARLIMHPPPAASRSTTHGLPLVRYRSGGPAMNWTLSYTELPALASHRSVGPPRCTRGTAIGTPAASAASLMSLTSCRDTPAGFSTTSDIRLAIRATHPP